MHGEQCQRPLRENTFTVRNQLTQHGSAPKGTKAQVVTHREEEIDVLKYIAHGGRNYKITSEQEAWTKMNQGGPNP